MPDLLKRIENQALSLSSQERAFLADRLLSSLGEDVLSDIDTAWIDEAERRYKEYKEGKRPGVSAKRVFFHGYRFTVHGFFKKPCKTIHSIFRSR